MTLSRFLIVELKPDLAAEHTTLHAVYLSLQLVSGVRTVTDLGAISMDTLADMVRCEDLRFVPKPKSTRSKSQT